MIPECPFCHSQFILCTGEEMAYNEFRKVWVCDECGQSFYLDPKQEREL